MNIESLVMVMSKIDTVDTELFDFYDTFFSINDGFDTLCAIVVI